MRTNIDLDDELLERARQLTGLRTKRAIVHEALRALVQIHEQATVRALRGKLKWEGDLHQQRFSRVENDDASGG